MFVRFLLIDIYDFMLTSAAKDIDCFSVAQPDSEKQNLDLSCVQYL